MSSVQIKDKAENIAPVGDEWLFAQDPSDPFTVKKMSTGTLSDYITTSFDSFNVKYTTTDYTILDDDEYDRIEVDTTTSAVTVTLPLMANNTGRRIEVALVGNDVSLEYPVTITPNAADANKLSNSGLASMTLLEPGQSVTLQQSDNSDCWEVVSQGIATYGGAPIYACRAWVNFDGTGTVTIRASGNVSSITDNRTGDYTVNFTTAMQDANYSVSGASIVGVGSDHPVGCVSPTDFTTSGFRAYTSGTVSGYLTVYTRADHSIINLSIFR